MAKIRDNSKALYDELEKRIQSKLVIASIIVERRAKQLCPRRTGRLARSITRQLEKHKAIIGSNVDYAPVVELGSKPHLIQPNKAGALWWAGAKHPVKVVRHPGTRPQPYLRPALEDSVKEIEKVFNEP
jgi:phage gpG-like protein